MAIFYHGTTQRSAVSIQRNGFRPRAPSRRVWFARNRHAAARRARAKAGQGPDHRPVVLTCEIDVGALMQSIGNGRVFHSRGILSVRGDVPASVVRSDRSTAAADPSRLLHEPAALAQWVNRLLELKPQNGVSRRHPGVLRLADWLKKRTEERPTSRVPNTEIAEVAARFLPDFFDGVAIDHEWMRSFRYRGSAAGDRSTLEPHVAEPASDTPNADDELEREALDCLASDKSRRRIRGLRLLADVEAPTDLVEWCLLFVDDDETDVSVAALQTMAARCEQVNPFLIEDLAGDQDRRLRAAALEVLAVHDTEGARRWLWEGLTDPETHVRQTLVRHLDRLDPAEHADVFETALTDPNPEIVRSARRLSAGQGIGQPTW